MMTDRQAFEFQSTLSAWGATRADLLVIDRVRISIHAPRVGSDRRVGQARADDPISIHAPRVGSDSAAAIHQLQILTFQSTLPAWGATERFFQIPANGLFQSTLPAWGATQEVRRRRAYCLISIHAPRVGSDVVREEAGMLLKISIHAPRVGSDDGGYCFLD